MTLSLQRDASGGRQQTRVIGSTSTTAHAALQSASVVYRNVSTDELLDLAPKSGSKEQREKALAVINETRKKLYLILADEG